MLVENPLRFLLSPRSQACLIPGCGGFWTFSWGGSFGGRFGWSYISLVLALPVFDRTHDRAGREITQRTQAAPLHLGSHTLQKFYVVRSTFFMIDSLHTPFQPVSPFA